MLLLYKNKSNKSLGNKIRNEKDRFEDIATWTKSIFWNDIDVSFYNGKGERLDVRDNNGQKISS